jgi:hypothetical protein
MSPSKVDYGIGSDNSRTASTDVIVAEGLMEATKHHQAARTKIPPVMDTAQDINTQLRTGKMMKKKKGRPRWREKRLASRKWQTLLSLWLTDGAVKRIVC